MSQNRPWAKPPIEHIDAIVAAAEAAEEAARLELAELEDKLREAREAHAEHARAVEQWRAVRDLVAAQETGRPEMKGPHSRACGPVPHSHGETCALDCPTCGVKQ